MQVILTQTIELFVIAFLALLVHQFVRGLLHTPQVEEIGENLEVQPVIYATLDWFTEPTPQEERDYWLECDVLSEAADVIELAKIKLRIPTNSLLNTTIRELKQLASQRKIRGYGKMKKVELIAALS